MTMNYTEKDIENLTKLTTHNADSETALLGTFEPDSVMSYEQIAHENGWTYFDAGNNGWRSMAEIDEKLAYKVNHEFLIKQIKEGKDFILTKSPVEAQNAFIKSGGKKFISYNDELRILKKNGYQIREYGDFWRAYK